MNAARMNCVEIVDLLVKAGADVNIKNNVCVEVVVFIRLLSLLEMPFFKSGLLAFLIESIVFVLSCVCMISFFQCLLILYVCSAWEDSFDGCHE